MQNYQFMSQAG